MKPQPPKDPIQKILHRWEERAIRYPWLVLVLFLLSAGLTLRYTMDHLKVNTNTADMISLEVPFQKRRLALENAFPQDVGTGLLVVEGPTPEATSEAVHRLVLGINGDPEHFIGATIPDGGPFLEKNGLLYLPLEDLEKLADKLAEAQPFIGRLSKDNTLRGLLAVLWDAISNQEAADLPIDLDPLLEETTRTVQGRLEQRPHQVSWQLLMMPDSRGFGTTKRFVQLRPVLHYEEVMPAEPAIRALDQLIAQTLTPDLDGVSIQKTGEFILEHEEMETISNGVSVASIASLLLVCLTLWFAYRSFKLVFATFLSLTLGLIFSLGFATVAIGQLNLISIGFAVLFIGMGDAYSSHFCLRYLELVRAGATTSGALRETLTSTGPALVLSALTAAIGLFSFIPTSYSGVAELGIIAGASMFIALFTTFTVLPAIMKILPIRRVSSSLSAKPRDNHLSNWPLKHAGWIRGITLMLALLSIGLIFKVQVDFNPLNLRDPHTESVRTFKSLLESEETSPMTLATLAHSEAEVRARVAAFKTLPTVNEARSLLDLIPGDQEEKLTLIGDLEILLGPSLRNFPDPTPGHTRPQDLDDFLSRIREQSLKDPGNPRLQALQSAMERLSSRLATLDEAAARQEIDLIEADLLTSLPKVIRELSAHLGAERITLESLPPSLKERWLSQQGLYRIQITPKKDLSKLENLREFILEAQTLDPDVTDLPVTYLESMNEVIKAFKEAFAIAFLATTLILLVVLRSLRDTALVLLPLLLASLLTAAMTVLLGIPFNFANIIALPLLFGLGVDSGIHMAHRLHAIERHGGALLDSSEARGVFYGALTTIFSFSSLALTPHQGTASMGLLLAIGLLITLFAALVVLPAFSRAGRPENRRHGVKSAH